MNDNIIDQNKSSDVDTLFPSLPIEEWEETKNTLHLFFSDSWKNSPHPVSQNESLVACYALSFSRGNDH